MSFLTTAACAFALAVLVGAAGCSKPPQSGLRTTQMRIGTQTFKLEIADTDETRTTGLMYRDSMPPDHGMIFVFPDEQHRAFYMKNTRIPLDIAYLDAIGRVVSIKQMKPYDMRSVPSDKPAKFAIELNEGAFAKAGVKVGDLLDVPADVGPAKE